MSAIDQWSKAAGGPIGIAVAVISVAGVLYFLGRKGAAAVAGAAKSAAKAVEEVNKGTSFEGAGVVGTLGNVTNELSGGFFERLGSSIGGTLADIADARRTKTAPAPTAFAPRANAVSTQAKYYDSVLFP